MTDKEIIKALELCFAEKNTNETCRKCPYHQFGELCKVERSRDSLDLINRQKAEIERLQGITTKKVCEGCEKLWIDSLLKAKAEAIKEFAERLKDRVVKKYEYTDVRIFNELDNLVKEMVGDDNA